MKVYKSVNFDVKFIKNKLQFIKSIKIPHKKQRLKVSKPPKASEKRLHPITNTSEFDVPDIFYSLNLFNYGATYLLEGIWQALQSMRDSTRDIWDFMKTVKVYVMSLHGLAKGIATMKHWLKSYLGPL